MSTMNHDEPYISQAARSESSLRFGEKRASVPASEICAEALQAPDTSRALPEGGWEGWGTAVGAFLVQFCTFGYMISFGVYQDFYAQTYITDHTSSTIAWVGSTNAFLLEICGLLAGRLYDRGYFHYVLYGAAFLQALSIFMLSLAGPNKYYQIFLAQGIGSGIAGGLLYIPSMAVVSHWFDERREKVMAFASSGAYLGAVVHPIILNNTINGQLGFANGVRVSAAIISGLLLVACLLMRTRSKPSESHANFLNAAKKCGRDNAFILGCLGLCVFALAFYYPLFYLQLDTAKHDLGGTLSFYSLVIMNAASFFGQLSCTVLLGFLRVPTVLIIATFFCGATLFAMIWVHTVVGVVAFGLFYGYFTGIFSALLAPLLALLTPDLSELGVRMGIGSAFMAASGLVGPPISGALLTPSYIWWRGAVFNGTATTLAGAIFVFMDRAAARRSQSRATFGPALAPEPSD